MPYIKKEDRKKFLVGLSYLVNKTKTAGELNYVLTMICLDYIKEHGKCYASMNDVVGALENCKQELYRRLIAPYEDIKIEENGDCYN